MAAIEDAESQVHNFQRECYWAHGMSINSLRKAINGELDIPNQAALGHEIIPPSELILRGVDKEGSHISLCDIALEANPSIQVFPPLFQQYTVDVRTQSSNQAERFCCAVGEMRFGLSFSVEYAGLGEEGMSRQPEPSTTDFYYRGIFTIVPTGRYIVEAGSLKLSKRLLSALRSLQIKINNAKSEKSIQSSCEDFFRAYGSHIIVGDIHLGGIYKWEGRYSGMQRSIGDATDIIEDVFSQKMLGASDKTVSSEEVAFDVTKQGGPQSECSFDLWKMYLESRSNMWTVIDRGVEYVGVWEILLNHNAELQDATELCNVLQHAWVQRHARLRSDRRQASPITDVAQTSDYLNPGNTGYVQPNPQDTTRDRLDLTNRSMPKILSHRILEENTIKTEDEHKDSLNPHNTSHVNLNLQVSIGQRDRVSRQDQLKLHGMKGKKESSDLNETQSQPPQSQEHYSENLCSRDRGYEQTGLKAIEHDQRQLQIAKEAIDARSDPRTSKQITNPQHQNRDESFDLVSSHQQPNQYSTAQVQFNPTSRYEETQSVPNRMEIKSSSPQEQMNTNPKGYGQAPQKITQDFNKHKKQSWVLPNLPSSEQMVLLKHLELEKYYPEKISISDVMNVGQIVIANESPQANVAWNILQRLVMLDHRGITSETRRCAEMDDSSPVIDDPNFDEFANIPDLLGGTQEFNPLDIFLTIFECCDLILRQVLVQKMYLCRLAVPFLFPSISGQTLTYSLWTLRTLVFEWRNKQQIAIETSAVNQPVDIVSFIRLERPRLSKSRLLNNIISDQPHETFFNVDCPNGDIERVTAEGLVEGSFFLPSGRETEQLEKVTMFLNLRGNGTQHKQQVNILSKLSNVVGVCVDISDLNHVSTIEAMQIVHEYSRRVVMILSNRQCLPSHVLTRGLQEYSQRVGSTNARNVKKLVTFTGKRDKNAAQLKTEARETIKSCLIEQEGMILSNVSHMMTEQGIHIDELHNLCQEGKSLADRVIACMPQGDHTSLKDKVLPLQGEHWQDWCKLLKRKKRSRHIPVERTGIQAIGKIEQKMKDHRKQQNILCNNLSPLISKFIDGLIISIDAPTLDFYIQWLKMYFDDISRKVLAPLQALYRKNLQDLKHNKKGQQKRPFMIQTLEQKIEDLEKKIEKSVFGMEHLMREIGQIYEATMENKSYVQQERFNKLPYIAANLLLKGHSLEVMDGDASGVPQTWLNAVFSQLETIVGKKKLFCLSVLGIQSSGKSTLLNTMFGLQFPVSAGRCTRGVYLQLIEVDKSSCLPFDYVAVMDSEGLRAAELGESKYNHDNELATFVIGLGNVTIINIKGENVSEVKDILQIVSHAFLRMMMVNRSIQKDRSCVFVHQNVPAVNAAEKMLSGSQKFEEALDRMTMEAALLENITAIHSFSQIIKFDNQKHVWYFPDLWHGEPPMASINTGYHEKVRNMKASILYDLAQRSQWFFGFSEMKGFFEDMWHGVIADDFVFGFRNSIVTKAYNHLEYKYSELKWALEVAVLDWKSNIPWGEYGTQEHLEPYCTKLQNDAVRMIRNKQHEVIKELNKFIDNDPQKEIMDPWKKDKEVAIQYKADSLCLKVKRDIDELQSKQSLNILKNNQHGCLKEEIFNKAMKLAEQMKHHSQLDKKILKAEFDKMWNEWASKIVHREQAKEGPIAHSLQAVLYDDFPQCGTIVHHLLESNPLSTHPTRGQKVNPIIGSLKLEHIAEGDLSFKNSKSWTQRIPGMGNKAEQSKARNIAVAVLDNIFQDVDLCLKDILKGSSGFQILDARKVIAIVRKGIRIFNNDQSNVFSMPTNFEVKIVVHVLKNALQVFQKVQDHYDEEYSVAAQLKVFKNTTWNLFLNHVNQTSKEIIAVDMICDQLEILIKEAVKQNMHLYVVKEIVPHFFTKNKLLKNILSTLAEKECFESYEAYVFNSRGFALDWLISYAEDYMFNERADSCWYIDHAKEMIADKFCFARKAIDMLDKLSVNVQTPGMWITEFTRSLTSGLSISELQLSHISQYEIHDVCSLKKLFLKGLQEIQDKIIVHFEKTTRENIKWAGKGPYELILGSLWGCEAACPFCKEPCIKSDPNHESTMDCHESIQHRPQAVSHRYFIGSDKLVVENCSYSVQATTTFTCHGFSDHQCQTTMEDSEKMMHPYRDYKQFVPTWSIPPSPDMDSSKYWMWYLTRFQQEIVDRCKKTPPDIPESWKYITKNDAIKSLFVYD